MITDSDITDATGNGRAAIYSGGDVDVSTVTRESMTSIVVGSAIAASFAGAGAVDYTGFSNTNRALVSEVDVYADGDLAVTASDFVTTFEAAGGANVGFEGGSAGGSFVVVENRNVTEAIMASAQTNAKGETLVRTKSTADIDSGAIMLGGGLAASFQGTFVFYNSSTDTRAIIEGGGSRAAAVNTDPAYDAVDQSVKVSAEDDTTVSHLFGTAAAAAGGGLAGALSILDIQNTVDAHIGSESQLSAMGDVTVQALSEKDIFSGAGGLSVAPFGVTGTIIVASIGTGLSSAGTSELGSAGVNQINSALTSAFDSTGLGDNRTPLSIRNQLAATDVSVDPLGSVDRSTEDVAAFIGEGADVFAGGNLTVDAKETIDHNSGAGSAALGGIAIGAAVSILDINTKTEAYIAGDSSEPDGSTIAVGGILTIQAGADETADVTSLAGGGGGAFALGVQYAEIDAQSSQLAFIGDGTQVLLAEQVNVLASHDRDFDSNSTGGAAAPFGIAAGVSAANVTAAGTVDAKIGVGVLLGEVDAAGNVVGTIGGLKVNATSNVANADSVANAAAGGISLGVFGNISDTEVNPTVNATVSNGTRIFVDGNVVVTSQTDQNANAGGFGLALGGGLSAGGSFADAYIEPTLTTIVGDSVEIQANEILIESLHNTDTDGVATGGEARVETTAASGAILASANGTDALAKGNATVGVQIASAQTGRRQRQSDRAIALAQPGEHRHQRQLGRDHWRRHPELADRHQYEQSAADSGRRRAGFSDGQRESAGRLQ